MNAQAIMTSPGMWIASSFMVIVVVVQSILFLKEGFKQAEEIGMPRSECIKGMRAALISAFGPALAPVIVLIALIAMFGAPTAWMRLNDIGAARTELAMADLAAKVAGVQLKAGAVDLKTFGYTLWGMALNNMGWMIVALISVSRMNVALKKMNEKYDPKWINLAMAGACIGLFAYLLGPNLIKGGGSLVAGVASFATMTLITKYAGKYQRLQELALGIAMLVGMFAAAALY